MKTFVIIFVVACFAGALGDLLTPEQLSKLKEYKDSCITESGVDPALVENAKKGEVTQPTEQLNCFAACMLKKFAVMLPDGTIDFDSIKDKIPDSVDKEKAEAVLDKCKDVDGANDCAKGGAVMQCFMENKSVLFEN
uniref:Putative odorant-binding protein 3 n=1 Tax=Sclerodermus sichuanensis TaxID=592144 RepID=A0A6G8D959_9HYME|nr:putative odorant-binding protein 3 [Sclerodermus sichuanensis]